MPSGVPHVRWSAPWALCHHDRMSGRPTRFEHFRYLGDKRTQIVYDLDDPATPADIIDDIVKTGQGTTFGPDSIPEARNRNYKVF